MQITILGTASMVPTKDRNHVAVFLSYKTEGFLFDCGEGTQRQFKKAGIPMTKVTRVFITHWHGDHTLGLPGLIQSLGAMEYQQTLRIYGPPKTKEYIARMFEAFAYDRRINLEVEETSGGIIIDTKDFYVEALPMEHGIPCLGFAMVEKERRRINMAKLKKLGIPEGPHLKDLQEGKSITYKGTEVDVNTVTTIVPEKKVAYITDTLICDNAIKLAKDADLLICESSFAHALEEKARKYKHMTSREAGLIANQSGAKKLVLIHFSARYKSTHEVEEDARDVFDNVIAAKDLMKITV